MLTPEQFDVLLRDATRGAKDATVPAGPRLVRAHHRARWRAGVLLGQTELVAELPDRAPAALRLDPWTPMILDRPADRPIAGALASGQTVLWLEPTTTFIRNRTVTLDWSFCAGLGTDGRSYLLGLPGDATSVLSLSAARGLDPAGTGNGAARTASVLATRLSDVVVQRPARTHQPVLGDSRALKDRRGGATTWGERFAPTSVRTRPSNRTQGLPTGRPTGQFSSTRAVPRNSRRSWTRVLSFWT